MEKISVYFNPEYIDNKPYFMIYIKDFGMWLVNEDEYTQILQKPTEEIKDVDLYASSRDFYKIVESENRDSIKYYNDFEDYKELKEMSIDFKNINLRSLQASPMFRYNFAEFFGRINAFINKIKVEE